MSVVKLLIYLNCNPIPKYFRGFLLRLIQTRSGFLILLHSVLAGFYVIEVQLIARHISK